MNRNTEAVLQRIIQLPNVTSVCGLPFGANGRSHFPRDETQKQEHAFVE